jgi:hypothetical protein
MHSSKSYNAITCNNNIILGSNNKKPIRKKHPSHYSCRAVDNNKTIKTMITASPPPSSPPNSLKEQSANIIIQGIVFLATETLRALGIGAKGYNDQLAAEEALLLSPRSPLSPGDIDGVLHLLTLDYQRSYFVTGVLEDRIYVEDCYFADPTVQFRGRELWKRNLKLLTPFLIDPSIQLRSLRKSNTKVVEVGVEDGAVEEALGVEADSFDTNNNVELLASWRLMTGLKLPWRPYIDIEGTTRYVLNEERNAICQHIEAWNITGLEALLIIFTPGRGN